MLKHGDFISVKGYKRSNVATFSQAISILKALGLESSK